MAVLLLAFALMLGLAMSARGAAKSKTKAKKPAASEVIVPGDAGTIRFPFKDDRKPVTRSFTLQAKPPVPAASQIQTELAGDLLTKDGDIFPVSQIQVTPKPSTFRNVSVVVRLDPDDATEVSAGEYTGTLTVSGPNITPGAVALDATIRDSKLEAVVWALLGFIFGVLVKVAGDFSRARPGPLEKIAITSMDATTAAGTPNVTKETQDQVAAGERYWSANQYFTSGAFWSSLLLGFVGALAAYALAYLGNDTWGADELDNWKLAAAAFAGVITGVSGADLVKPFRPTPT